MDCSGADGNWRAGSDTPEVEFARSLPHDPSGEIVMMKHGLITMFVAVLATVFVATAARAQTDVPISLSPAPGSLFSATQTTFDGLNIPFNAQSVTLDFLFDNNKAVEVVSNGGGGNFVADMTLIASDGTLSSHPDSISAYLIAPDNSLSALLIEAGYNANQVVVNAYEDIGEYNGDVFIGVRLTIDLPGSGNGAVLKDGSFELRTSNDTEQLRIVPEPTSAVLLGLGGLLALRRRRANH
jgi:hypothetical protein